MLLCTFIGTNNFSMIDNLEKNVYKYIAYQYKESVVNIKNNIVKSSRNIIKDEIHLSAKDVITTILIEINNEFIFS